MQREMLYVLRGEPHSYVTEGERLGVEWSPKKEAHKLARVSLVNQHDGKPLFTGPVEVLFTFYFKYPVQSQKRQGVGPYYTTSPSLLFLYRFMQEVARGILFERFNTIVDLHMIKMYDENPRTEIVIKEID
jgi:Holliday junction resolvase RusA-like endonuclease